MSDSDKEEGLLSRWSRRKLAVAQEREGPAEQPAAELSTPDSDAQSGTEAERAAVLKANREAAEAVDLDGLTADSDFTIFMKEGVPDLLKRKALAVLWRSNPVLANVDGLVDYDDDFGSPDLILKTFKSAWQAGRGYLKEEEDLSEDLADQSSGSEPETVADSEEAQAVAEPDEETDAPESDEVSETPISEVEAPSDNQPEPEPIGEEDPLPRVSLRKRLMLDQHS